MELIRDKTGIEVAPEHYLEMNLLTNRVNRLTIELDKAFETLNDGSARKHAQLDAVAQHMEKIIGVKEGSVLVDVDEEERVLGEWEVDINRDLDAIRADADMNSRLLCNLEIRLSADTAATSI
jgi:hypothetical protein